MKNYQNIFMFSPEVPQWQLVTLQNDNATPTVLSTELINDYLSAWYQVQIESAHLITLHIGEYTEPLATLLQTTGSRHAAYITACNPASQILAPEENRVATVRLREQLTSYSKYIYAGESIDPAGKWPAEASFLVLGIDLAAAATIGYSFGQNAILWINTDAIPRLVLLR